MSTIALRRASFPEDSAVVSSLLDDYLRQTENEKVEHGLELSADPLPERYRREVAHPAARGRGVGSALIGEALRHSDRPVRLSVWDWRVRAIRMYRKHGFVSVPPRDARERLLWLELPD